MGEKEMENIFIEELKDLEKEFDVKINKKVKIASDLTCIKDRDRFKLAISFSEVDIAFYKQIDFGKVKRLSNYLKFSRDTRDKKDRDKLNIPFIIIELKSGKITTDSIRARGIVARKIKNIFPFAHYLFVAENTTKTYETLLRWGKDFDNFFIYDHEVGKKEIDEIKTKFIEPYLKNIKKLL